MVTVSKAQSSPTNFHAPVSGSDSIKFTADTSAMKVKLFNPGGGTNHVVVHDITANSNLFNDDVMSDVVDVTGFTAGHSYYIKGYNGSGTSTSFPSVTSSHATATTYPMPFTGYTQYYSLTRTQGPSDGVVVILMEDY